MGSAYPGFAVFAVVKISTANLIRNGFGIVGVAVVEALINHRSAMDLEHAKS
jgi:hypothetical protein